MEQTRRRLSVRDEAKPFVLIGAIVAGVAVNRVTDGRLAGLSLATDIGLFLVIFAIMAFVEPGDVRQAFGKVKPTAPALTTNFVLTPLYAWMLGWLLLRHHPDLWAGVILYALTPCIGWYLIFIDLAEGDCPGESPCCPGTWPCRSRSCPSTCGCSWARCCPPTR